jgi:hypothetical protein
VEIVALVEDLAMDVRPHFFELADLPVLLGDQFLAHRGDLDVHIVVREIEVRPEE